MHQSHSVSRSYEHLSNNAVGFAPTPLYTSLKKAGFKLENLPQIGVKIKNL